MLKKGFTLIELIFTIVIIGILASVAIPKYQNLKAKAQMNNMFKVLNDGAQSAYSAYINAVELEGINENDVKLNNLIKISGKGWSYNSYGQGSYRYQDTSIGQDVLAFLSLVSASTTGYSYRRLTIHVNCNNISDQKTKEICIKKNDNKAISFNYLYL